MNEPFSTTELAITAFVTWVLTAVTGYVGYPTLAIILGVIGAISSVLLFLDLFAKNRRSKLQDDGFNPESLEVESEVRIETEFK